MPRDYQIALLALGALWIGCALVPRSVRTALANGLRCMSRYPDLWRIPLIFGLVNGLFQIAAQIMIGIRTESDFRPWLTEFSTREVPSLSLVASQSWLPALDSAAQIFTVFTTTFPLSALCALALLFNRSGLFGEFARAVMKRFPRLGWLLIPLLVICTLGAILHPVAYLFLPEAMDWIGYYGVVAVNCAGFVFVLLLGIYFLAYLMLMAFAWMRGMQFHRFKLMQVAARRTGFLLKWAIVIAAASLLLIVLPQWIALAFDEVEPALSNMLRAVSHWGMVATLAAIFIFCPVPAILVFHNESLRQAFHDGIHFWRENAGVLVPFLTAVFLPMLVVASMHQVADFVLEPESLLGASAGLLIVLANSMLAGWFIAAWVCLYKSRFSKRREIPF